MSSSLEQIEVYSAIVFYAKLKTAADIMAYIKNFTDARVLFDKRSVEKLFITNKDPRKEKEEDSK